VQDNTTTAPSKSSTHPIEWLSTGEVAIILQVSRTTVLRFVRDGLLKATTLNPNYGRKRFDKAQILALAAKSRQDVAE